MRLRTRRANRSAGARRPTLSAQESEQALRGARLVASLPLDVDDEVLIASILERPVLIGAWGYVRTPATAELYGQSWEQAWRDARRAVESGSAVLAESRCGVRRLVHEGHAVKGLIGLISKTAPDVVVVGPHGRGQLDSIPLGSVTQSLLHAMPASVLIAREPVRAPQRVLLATDGSDHSLAAAGLLARFPLPLDAQIHVVTVDDVRHLPPLPHDDVADMATRNWRPWRRRTSSRPTSS